ncbi:hypothetical protein [Lentzea aerocolonigenes]|uniref:hypothetical protein n=1 Tax=Lentzea aerocolonigenes TaxID=68170 RepID=UPI000B12BF93|nr:hypothetical protein [Lentzea aerocolonigenes]MCP2243823.1 hypothetical protein [Lentzea aerocolonigenes]
MRRAVVLALLVVAAASSAGPEVAFAGAEVVAARPSADGPGTQTDGRPCRTKRGHSRKCVTWKCRSAWKRACRLPRRAHDGKVPKATTVEKARIYSRRLRS